MVKRNVPEKTRKKQVAKKKFPVKTYTRFRSLRAEFSPSGIERNQAIRRRRHGKIGRFLCCQVFSASRLRFYRSPPVAFGGTEQSKCFAGSVRWINQDKLRAPRNRKETPTDRPTDQPPNAIEKHQKSLLWLVAKSIDFTFLSQREQ